MSYYTSQNIKRCDRQFRYAKFQVADFSTEYFLLFQMIWEICVKCFNALEKLLKKLQLATAADKQHHTEESTRNETGQQFGFVCTT